MTERRATDLIILERLASLENKLLSHIADETAMFESINRAFPDGPENHRLAHAIAIEAADAEKKFWRELKLNLIEKGLWSIILVLIGLALTGVSAKITEIVK